MDNSGTAITNTQVGPSAAPKAATPPSGMYPMLGSSAYPMEPTPTTPPPAVVGLPNAPTSPTGPTGVATSSLADDTLATQHQGTQNIQSNVDQHAVNKSINAANPKVSIVDLLNSKGISSDYASRSKMAQVAGIPNYVGTADQNAQLIGWFDSTGGQGMTGGASTQGTTTGAQTGNSSATNKNGQAAIPGQPTTGSPGDVYSSAIDKNQQDISDALQQRNSQVQQIMNGTFPLSAYQQAILDNTQKQFDAIAKLQAVSNTSYNNSVALAGNRLGTNIQNPAEYAAEQNKAVNDGLTKINNLDATAALTMSQLRQSFLDKDYQMINDNYTALQKTLEAKAAAITALQKRTDDLFTSTRDFNEKVTEFKQSQAQQAYQFAQTQALEKAKFTAQYAGLVDPNTGLFKPSADPAALPGINSLPSGIGTGPGAHYLDVGQVPDKGLATYLIQAAKANGFGVVDTTNNKTFNQSLVAYNGLTDLLSSGQYNSNTQIKDIIGNKKSSSITLRIFGSTQPDSISSVLGAGGANIPNINKMTLGQAQQFLQSSIYSTMGTNSVAQKYAMNPAMATADLQTYYHSTPANAEAVNKLLTATPGLTDSQVLQVLTSQ